MRSADHDGENLVRMFVLEVEERGLSFRALDLVSGYDETADRRLLADVILGLRDSKELRRAVSRTSQRMRKKHGPVQPAMPVIDRSSGPVPNPADSEAM